MEQVRENVGVLQEGDSATIHVLDIHREDARFCQSNLGSLAIKHLNKVHLIVRHPLKIILWTISPK